jgi:hypothetical protein
LFTNKFFKEEKFRLTLNFHLKTFVMLSHSLKVYIKMQRFLHLSLLVNFLVRAEIRHKYEIFLQRESEKYDLKWLERNLELQKI